MESTASPPLDIAVPCITSRLKMSYHFKMDQLCLHSKLISTHTWGYNSWAHISPSYIFHHGWWFPHLVSVKDQLMIPYWDLYRKTTISSNQLINRYSTCGVCVKSYNACQENALVIFHPKENNIYSWIFCINKMKPSLVPLLLTDIDIYYVS